MKTGRGPRKVEIKSARTEIGSTATHSTQIGPAQIKLEPLPSFIRVRARLETIFFQAQEEKLSSWGWAFRHLPWCPPEPRHCRQRRCRVVPFDLDGDVEVDVPPSSLTEVWTSRSRSSTSPRCLSTAATTMLATSAMSQSTTARRCCLRRSPRRRRP